MMQTKELVAKQGLTDTVDTRLSISKQFTYCKCDEVCTTVSASTSSCASIRMCPVDRWRAPLLKRLGR